MHSNCKRYFVDPNKLTEGAQVEKLEKHGEQELTHEYEALLDMRETAANGNKLRARKWIEAISSNPKKPEGKNA